MLLAAHRARESDDRTVLSAPAHRAPRRAWSAGTAEQSVRSTVVEAADQAATSSLGKRLRLQPRPSPRCAARASPVRRHHRAPTVRAANRRSEPGHARTPCAFRHSSSCLGCGCTPFGRAPSTRALLGPACKETWDHLRATFALAPFAGRGATMATVVATDATREQHEEQSAVDGSPSAVPTVASSDAGEPSAAVSNRAVELTAVDGSLLLHFHSPQS